VNSHYKYCTTCNHTKHRDMFSEREGAKDGKQGKCKSCFRIYQRARKYGLSEDHFRVLLESQDYKCAICHTPDRSLVVDHNHKTGAVRGLLCSNCNTGIGLLQDSPEIMRAAEGYLIQN